MTTASSVSLPNAAENYAAGVRDQAFVAPHDATREAFTFQAPNFTDIVQPDELHDTSSLNPSVMIFGEQFLVEIDRDLGVVLQHSRWSLLGYGETIADAEKLLIERGKELGDVMTQDDFGLKLNADGMRLRDFVVGLRYITTTHIPLSDND